MFPVWKVWFLFVCFLLRCCFTSVFDFLIRFHYLFMFFVPRNIWPIRMCAEAPPSARGHPPLRERGDAGARHLMHDGPRPNAPGAAVDTSAPPPARLSQPGHDAPHARSAAADCSRHQRMSSSQATWPPLHLRFLSFRRFESSIALQHPHDSSE